MVISEPAVIILESSRDRLLSRIASARIFRRPGSRSFGAEPVAAGAGDDPAVVAVATDYQDPGPSDAMLAQSEGPLAAAPRPEHESPELSADERRARAIALRGLSQARAGRFDDARSSFAEAACLDPALDLARVPTFWNLPRGAQQAAVEAYEQIGRSRDALALTASIRSTFRPKLVRARRSPTEAARPDVPLDSTVSLPATGQPMP